MNQVLSWLLMVARPAGFMEPATAPTLQLLWPTTYPRVVRAASIVEAWP
jgi:hypothetical protein